MTDALPQEEAITLSNGTTYTLRELTLGALRDFKKEGHDLEDIFEKNEKGERVADWDALSLLVWFSVRTRKDAKASWEPVYEDFLEQLTLSDLQTHMPTLMKFLAAPFQQQAEQEMNSS